MRGRGKREEGRPNLAVKVIGTRERVATGVVVTAAVKDVPGAREGEPASAVLLTVADAGTDPTAEARGGVNVPGGGAVLNGNAVEEDDTCDGSVDDDVGNGDHMRDRPVVNMRAVAMDRNRSRVHARRFVS